MTSSPAVVARLLRVSSGEKFVLGTAAFRIGRDPDCTLRLTDPHVSRAHAEIRREGSHWIVYDLSTNGTLVNAQRVQGNRALAHGDMIQIAAESFVFMVGVETTEEATEPVPAPARAAAERIPPFEPPRPRERTGQTDPGDETAFVRARRRGTPVWVYIGVAVVIAVALFFGIRALLGS